MNKKVCARRAHGVARMSVCARARLRVGLNMQTCMLDVQAALRAFVRRASMFARGFALAYVRV